MKQNWKENKLLLLLGIASLVICVLLGLMMVVSLGNPGTAAQTDAPDVAIMDRYDMFMNNTISDSLDGILSIEKV